MTGRASPSVVRRRDRARRAVAAIDTVLDRVEEHHLRGRSRFVPPHPEWIVTLQRAGGLTVPDSILELRDTLQLHGALLDWQEELLSVVRGGPADGDGRDG